MPPRGTEIVLPRSAVKQYSVTSNSRQSSAPGATGSSVALRKQIAMTDLVRLAKRNAARWAAAKLTRGPEFGVVAKPPCAPDAKARYRAVESQTSVLVFRGRHS
jgi:hypothetical protein